MENKLQVFTSDLKIGMYVTELDRPWVDTPFLFQGFTLKNAQEISELSEFCDFVFIDEEMSLPGVTDGLHMQDLTQANTEKPREKRKEIKFSETEFRQALLDSFRVYKEARSWIDTMLEDSRLGNSVDTAKARKVVTQLADEVITNPDAMLWLTNLRSRDEYTATHSMNVCILGLTFGRSLDLDDDQLHKLGMGTLLHDIGKMQIPDDILNKHGSLTKLEFDIIMQHPSIGHAMLVDDKELDMESLHIILHHHERLDGGGYPNGISENEIPLLTRIASIVDVYDAICSNRVYHNGISPASALENLFKWAAGNFEVALLEKFIKCLGIYPTGSVVRLNTQEVGLVVATHVDHHIKPIVLLTTSAQGKPYLPRHLVNLSSDVWEKTGKPITIIEVLEPGSLGIEMKTILQEEFSYSVNTA